MLPHYYAHPSSTSAYHQMLPQNLSGRRFLGIFSHLLTQGLCVFGARPYPHADSHIEHQNYGHRDYEEGARGYLPDRKTVLSTL